MNKDNGSDNEYNNKNNNNNYYNNNNNNNYYYYYYYYYYSFIPSNRSRSLSLAFRLVVVLCTGASRAQIHVGKFRYD